MIANNELERIVKELIVIQFTLLSWNLPANIEENQENSVKIVGVPTEIRTRRLLNTSQKHYILR
jgi:hypothetical protein